MRLGKLFTNRWVHVYSGGGCGTTGIAIGAQVTRAGK